ncbi:enoyl-CoA hydratase/isomerase family protein [Thamnocephalis sphaerospora]|uniref:Enoyl-CoA hydratase/isomerase family protein n=1 Tax=Thamnocephalis sphaerospora TaxID=78915 RepID=A0A4P9XTF9_9FUNG|nr:enoyl-CoA hydratase/isomerase family protein [Thamnocephalis sphaerospora]|eukprot:RKP09443.1 enoyl-CoA hydratase/isomerase family protein [Thamnocephalis sphaerospora]
MSAYNDIIYAVSADIATVTLNRPQRGNAISPRMRDELIQAFEQAVADPVVRAVVLTGAGRYFCTGMDLAQTGSRPDAAVDPVDAALRMFDAVRHCPKPVIARVNGPAVGGGVGLVFCADIRLAPRSTGVYFRLAEVERGLVPAVISRYIVPDLGPMRARQLMLTAERVTVADAADHWPGFLTSAVADEKALDAAVAEYTHMLCGNAPQAMADVKRLVAVQGGGLPSGETAVTTDALAAVRSVFSRMLQSKEAAYGIGEFMAKRRPDWSAFVTRGLPKSKL